MARASVAGVGSASPYVELGQTFSRTSCRGCVGRALRAGPATAPSLRVANYLTPAHTTRASVSYLFISGFIWFSSFGLSVLSAAPAAAFDPLTMDPGCNDGATKVPLAPTTVALG